MSEPEHDPHDGVMALVRRLAMMVLSSPPEERERQYALAQELGYDAALQGGLSEDDARDAGVNLERWTRSLVDGVLAADAADDDPG